MRSALFPEAFGGAGAAGPGVQAGGRLRPGRLLCVGLPGSSRGSAQRCGAGAAGRTGKLVHRGQGGPWGQPCPAPSRRDIHGLESCSAVLVTLDMSLFLSESQIFSSRNEGWKQLLLEVLEAPKSLCRSSPLHGARPWGHFGSSSHCSHHLLLFCSENCLLEM